MTVFLIRQYLFELIKRKLMMQLQLRIPELQIVFDEFICPITRFIMSDPVLGHEDTSFERSAIEQWIDKFGIDPITLQPLQKKDLKPNQPLRDCIYKFLQGLTSRQKERLQYLNVKQAARLLEKELGDIAQRTSSLQKEVQKLLEQLTIIKNQLFVQKQQKEFAIRQCQIQKYQAKIDRIKLSSCENQMVQIKSRILVLQQQIKNNKNQIEVSRQENPELRQLQKNYCLETKELQQTLNNELVRRSRNVKITPDKKSRGLKDGNWAIDNTNPKVCIRNTESPCNWLCSSALPFDGEFVFTIKVIKLTNKIRIGVMEEQKKGEKLRDTWNYSVFLDPLNQSQFKPDEERTGQQRIDCLCSSLPKCPFQIECHANRQQNTIAWYYDGKQQAKSTMPLAWQTNKMQLCVIFWVQNKGDSVQMI